MIITKRQLRRIIREVMELDLEVGDVILTGKFKNKRKVVKDFGKDDLGQPTINGTKALTFRIEKLMPKEKWSKKSKEALEFAEKVDEMKITKRQLRRIILEALTSGTPMTSIEDFKGLQPGDMLTLNGAPIVVVSVDLNNAAIVYVKEGKSVLKDFDFRLATIYPDDPPDLIPELEVIYQGSGPPPTKTRQAPRKKGPGRSYSYYD